MRQRDCFFWLVLRLSLHTNEFVLQMNDFVQMLEKYASFFFLGEISGQYFILITWLLNEKVLVLIRAIILAG